MASFTIPRAIALLPLLAAPAAAQQPDRYEPVFDALRQMTARADSVASVHNVSLQRDAIHFQLDNGTLYLATPVAGRAIAVIFIGEGSVTFTAIARPATGVARY